MYDLDKSIALISVIKEKDQEINNINENYNNLKQLYTNLQSSTERLAQAHANALSMNSNFERQIETAEKTVKEQRNHINKKTEEEKNLKKNIEDLENAIKTLSMDKEYDLPDRPELLERLIKEFIAAPGATPDKMVKQQLISVLMSSQIHNELKEIRKTIQDNLLPKQSQFVRASVTYEDCVSYLAHDNNNLNWLDARDYMSNAAQLVSNVFGVQQDKLIDDVIKERTHVRSKNR